MSAVDLLLLPAIFFASIFITYSKTKTRWQKSIQSYMLALQDRYPTGLIPHDEAQKYFQRRLQFEMRTALHGCSGLLAVIALFAYYYMSPEPETTFMQIFTTAALYGCGIVTALGLIVAILRFFEMMLTLRRYRRMRRATESEKKPVYISYANIKNDF